MRPMSSPATESELSEMLAEAKGPLRVVGGGTRPVGRPVAGEVLSVAGLSGIELYEPGALTIVAKAGTPLAEVEAALAAEGQRLPFEPMDHRALLGTKGAADHRRCRGRQCLGAAPHSGGGCARQPDRGAVRRWHRVPSSRTAAG
jgi:FAD/FMN-containing dehydrogenase